MVEFTTSDNKAGKENDQYDFESLPSHDRLFGGYKLSDIIKFKSDKPTVESVNLMYIDRLGKYAAVIVIDTLTEQKHLLIEDSVKKFYPMKRAQEIAEMIGVRFIDETKDERSN